MDGKNLGSQGQVGQDSKGEICGGFLNKLGKTQEIL